MKKKRKRKREEGGCGLIGWADGSWVPGLAQLAALLFFLFKTFSFLFSGLFYNLFI
jgi:hypothetical protein